MSTTESNNKRIAKNTLMLYFRMILLMLVSLYTSRVVLNALGVEDYGIYNVVGGVVAMFSLISRLLSGAISRFITFELGRGNTEKLKRIFSTSVTIQLIFSLIIAVLIEAVGVWFLNHKMVIPAERITAANWVMQLSIIALVVNLISLPYNAAIIAHEHMSAFAYISILEAVGKLVIAFLIVHSPIDRLIFYAALVVAVAVMVRLVYGIYCNRHFDECASYQIGFDRELLKEMFGYSIWNFIGSTSAVLRDQGGNIIINLFFGPAVNAARGIEAQVNHAITGFVSNFTMALNPQIIKSYASGRHDYMMTLIFQGARLSFYMLLLLSLPVIINAHYILLLWLKIVPEHTVFFVRLTLIFAMSESISGPLITSMAATGKIRNYQLLVGGLQMMNLPVSYVLLRLGCIPETVLIVAIVISQLCLAGRLYMLRRMIGLRVRAYLKKVYFNVITVAVISALIPCYAGYALPENFINFVIVTLISLACCSLTVYFIGCNKAERVKVRVYAEKAKKKVFR